MLDAGGGRLVALIVPDMESASSQSMDNSELSRQMDDNIRTLNQNLPAYSQVQSFRIQEEEFEKTPKRSIKRYLYKA